MTTIYVVHEWDSDHTSNIVGIFAVEATAEGVAQRNDHRTVEPYELDTIKEWARS